MTEKNQENTSSLKSYFSWPIVIIVALTAFFLILLATYRIYVNSLYNAQIEKLHKEGYPINIDEFIIWHSTGFSSLSPNERIPSKENAAKPMQEAFNKMTVDDEKISKKAGTRIDSNYLSIIGQMNDKDFIYSKPDKIIKTIIETNNIALDVNSDFFAYANKAVKKNRLIFPFKKKDIMLFFKLSKMRYACRLYAMSFYTSALEHNPAIALDEMKSTRKYLNLIMNQPFLISYLVNIGCNGIFYDYINYSIQTCSFTNSQLEEIKNLIRQTKFISPFKFAIRSEATFFILWNEQNPQCILLEMYNLCFEELFGKQKTVKTIFLKLEQILLLDKLYMNTGLKISDKVAKLPLEKSYSDLKPDLDEIQHSTPFIFRKNSPFSYLTTSVSTLYRFKARQQCLLTAVSIKQYINKYKKTPDTLNDLVPEFLDEIPLDPFTGKPLKYLSGSFSEKQYVKTEKKIPESTYLGYELDLMKIKGITIYSIGENLKDDHGELKDISVKIQTF